MNKNGRPNLGYSNIYWQRIERSPEAKIYNREELIQEILDEPVCLSIKQNIDRLQLVSLNGKLNKGELDDGEARYIKIIERDENNRYIDVKRHWDAI